MTTKPHELNFSEWERRYVSRDIIRTKHMFSPIKQPLPGGKWSSGQFEGNTEFWAIVFIAALVTIPFIFWIVALW